MWIGAGLAPQGFQGVGGHLWAYCRMKQGSPTVEQRGTGGGVLGWRSGDSSLLPPFHKWILSICICQSRTKCGDTQLSKADMEAALTELTL